MDEEKATSKLPEGVSTSDKPETVSEEQKETISKDVTPTPSNAPTPSLPPNSSQLMEVTETQKSHCQADEKPECMAEKTTPEIPENVVSNQKAEIIPLSKDETDTSNDLKNTDNSTNPLLEEKPGKVNEDVEKPVASSSEPKKEETPALSMIPEESVMASSESKEKTLLCESDMSDVVTPSIPSDTVTSSVPPDLVTSSVRSEPVTSTGQSVPVTSSVYTDPATSSEPSKPINSSVTSDSSVSQPKPLSNISTCSITTASQIQSLNSSNQETQPHMASQFAGAINLTISNGAINFRPVSTKSEQENSTAQQCPVTTIAKGGSNTVPRTGAVLGSSAAEQSQRLPLVPSTGGSLISAKQAVLFNQQQIRAGIPVQIPVTVTLHSSATMQSSPVGAPMVALPSGAIRPANPRSATINAQGRPVFPPQRLTIPASVRPMPPRAAPPTSHVSQPPPLLRTTNPSAYTSHAPPPYRPPPLSFARNIVPKREPLIGQPAVGVRAMGQTTPAVRPIIMQPGANIAVAPVRRDSSSPESESGTSTPVSEHRDEMIGQPRLGKTEDLSKPGVKTSVILNRPGAVKTSQSSLTSEVNSSESSEVKLPTDGDAAEGVDLSQGGDFDMESALEWENGIGTLPGSNLKFKINEFGHMEMITEEFEFEPMETSTGDFDNQDEFGSGLDSARTSPVPNGDSECRCENCGTKGKLDNFCNSGRFCSRSCVGAFAGKSRRGGIRKQPILDRTSDQLPLGLKRKKRRPTDDDMIDYSNIRFGDMDESERKALTSGPTKRSRTFSWNTYLEQEKAIGAPHKLFKNPFPVNKNAFRVGMKLEGIDPRHPSLYCVLTVSEVRGYRLRLHFDGFSECYDFWTNADSPYIFPAGWAEKNGKFLQPPKGFTSETFNWTEYLKTTKSSSAPKNLFTTTQVSSVTPHGFRQGMKLEAVDKKNSTLICVATVVDVLGDNILIHFDGWEDSYDYWCDPSSPYIHPVGWCFENLKALSPPNDWKDVESFTWEEYLQQQKCQAVAARAFKLRQPHGFEVGMKIEIVDRRNPILIRVATVLDIEAHRFLVHFDGWSNVYDYWVDDDCPDIHPPGWCSKTGHPLTTPISPEDLVSSETGCPTPGCKGIGHIKGAKYTGHHSAFGCPYSALNMNKESALQDRLGPTRLEIKEARAAAELQNIEQYDELPSRKTKFINGDVEENYVKRPGRKKKRPKLMLHGKKKHLRHMEDERSPEARLHDGIHQSVFMAPLVPPPARDLPHCWEQHTKLLPDVHKYRANDVAAWSIQQVVSFVEGLPGCQEQACIFQEEQIDGEAFLLLNQADIVNILNVKLGPAIKIYNSILIFKNAVDV